MSLQKKMTTSATSSNRPKLALLDCDIFVYRVGFASEDSEEHFAIARVTDLVNDIVFQQLACDDYKAYITGRGNFRNDVAITAPYKGNRKDMKKPKHYNALRKHLQRLGAQLVEGMEADDAIAIEATNMRDSCYIVSIDKDLDQVPGYHYNFVKKEEYYVTDEEGLLSFYKQILTGDKVDNIIGIKGVGPVKAAKLLEGCKTEQEMYDVCVKAYNDAGEDGVKRVTENGKLLWLLRNLSQQWLPPSSLQASNGQLQSEQTSANTDAATTPPKPST